MGSRLLSNIEHHSILQSFSSPDEFAAQASGFEAFLSLIETSVTSTTGFQCKKRRQRQIYCWFGPGPMDWECMERQRVVHWTCFFIFERFWKLFLFFLAIGLVHKLLIHGAIKYIDHQEEEEDACDKMDKPEKFRDSTLEVGDNLSETTFMIHTRPHGSLQELNGLFQHLIWCSKMAIFPLHIAQVEHVQSISIASEWRVLPLRCHVLFSSPPLWLQTIR